MNIQAGQLMSDFVMTPEGMVPLYIPSRDYFFDEHGEPVSESIEHSDVINATLNMLRDLFGDQPHFLATNLWWYYDQEAPHDRRAPDIMVVKDVGNQRRDNFTTWNEKGAVPSVIFEITSKGTWGADMFDKKLIYQEYGVREYFMFDPLGDMITGQLTGYRLSPNGEYLRIRPNPEGFWQSQQLGLFLKPEDVRLRFFDLGGNPIPTPQEARDSALKLLGDERKAKEEAQKQVDDERKAKEEAQKIADDERKAKEEAQKQVDDERKAKEEAQKQADDERKAKEEAQKIADQAQKQADDERKATETMAEQLKKAQEELQRLREALKPKGDQN
jgi:Uma2 family endonuclease